MWSRCWSVGRVVLGLTDDQFFSLTPRNYHALLEQNEHQLEYQEFLFAQLNATVCNWSMNTPKKPLTPLDFMSRKSTKHSKPRTRKKRINQQGLAAGVRAAFSSHPNLIVIEPTKP